MFAGSTVASWQLLRGRKEEGTDPDSYTARILGITRDNAKVLNLARLYSAELEQASQLLLQFNPQLSDAEASRLVREVYRRTKGIKRFARPKNATDSISTADAEVSNDGANTAESHIAADIKDNPAVAQNGINTKGQKKKDNRFQVDSNELNYLHDRYYKGSYASTYFN